MTKKIKGLRDFTYYSLIKEAIYSTKNMQATVSEIFDYCVLRFPDLFRALNAMTWKGNIRQVLSRNPEFIKMHKSGSNKEHFWSHRPMEVLEAEERRALREARAKEHLQPNVLDELLATGNEASGRNLELSTDEAQESSIGSEFPMQRANVHNYNLQRANELGLHSMEDKIAGKQIRVEKYPNYVKQQKSIDRALAFCGRPVSSLCHRKPNSPDLTPKEENTTNSMKAFKGFPNQAGANSQAGISRGLANKSFANQHGRSRAGSPEKIFSDRVFTDLENKGANSEEVNKKEIEETDFQEFFWDFS